MYAQWARVTRTAAVRASRARVATRPDRCFHASAPVRAADAAADTSDPNNAPRDDGGEDKPNDGEAGVASQENTKEENLFGDKGLNGNGDARGRQRRPNGTSRLRAARHRTPEELPSIHLPARFHEDHIFRSDDQRQDLPSPSSKESGASASSDAALFLKQLEELKERSPDQLGALDRVWESTFEAAAWSEAEVQAFKESVELDDLELVSRRGVVMLLAAWNAILKGVPALHEEPPAQLEEFTKTIQKIRDYRKTQDRTDKMKIHEMAIYHAERMLPYELTAEDESSMLKNILSSKVRYHSHLGIAHHDALLEATSSIRADFAISPPKNIKVAEFKRPLTLLNFSYYNGFDWPKYIMQDIAAELGADVVHITGQDLAQIAGSYLGQDVTRAPGPLSLLGYKAADHAGRTQRRKVEQPDEEYRADVPFSIVMHAGKPKKEGKKKLSIMDYVLGESNRGKSDEMWVDLKINAVLEELVHAADTDFSPQRPLIVHVHDINALNMDEECGAIILGKLRKIVDDLWVEGRKIVLVGTCSSSDAPLAYQTALKELKNTERLVDLHTLLLPSKSTETALNDASTLGHNSRKGFKSFTKRLQEMARNECLGENTNNISAMLRTLVDTNDGQAPHIDFSLKLMDVKHRPQVLSEKLLPVSDVHRIVKTMIGLRRQHPSVFNQAVLEEAVRLIKHNDEANDRLTTILDKVEGEIKRNLTNDSGRQSTDYEQRFLSAIVNPKDLKTTFNDIHAPRETIDSIKMLTQLSLLRPEAFAYGVLATDRIPGCLLYGPPGTGKTLLAKAVAKESGANMIEVSGASINQMYVGESEKNIRALFSLAKKKEPLVIFIDEADALLGARGGRNDAAGRRDVINQFLREWDGMEASKAFIMVATNRPFDLDEAVLRRLPRKLLVDLPLEADRAAILKIHLKNEALDDTVSIEKMAKQTTLYSGSDLKNVCVAAAMAAVREELEASEKHTGPEPYVWPPKRILNTRHFDKALGEIPASVSEDMATLNAIKKFDERYGEKKTRRKRRGMGFEVIPEATDSHEARVRSSAGHGTMLRVPTRKRNTPAPLLRDMAALAATATKHALFHQQSQPVITVKRQKPTTKLPTSLTQDTCAMSDWLQNPNLTALLNADEGFHWPEPTAEDVDFSALLGEDFSYVDPGLLQASNAWQQVDFAPRTQLGDGGSQLDQSYRPQYPKEIINQSTHDAAVMPLKPNAAFPSVQTRSEPTQDSSSDRYQCLHCSECFDSEASLERHAESFRHATLRCRNEGCIETFPTSIFRENHELRYHSTEHFRVGPKGPLVCVDCDAGFELQRQLRDHACMEKHSSYQCRCGVRFATLDVLYRHIDSQANDMPKYPCKSCKRHRGRLGFRRRDHLVQHLRGYHKFDSEEIARVAPSSKRVTRNRWQCPHVNCEHYRGSFNFDVPHGQWQMDLPFSKESELSKHLKEVHDESPFPCDFRGCERVGGKGYMREKDLMKHWAAKHPEIDQAVVRL